MTGSLYSEILPNLWQGGTDDYDTVDFPVGFNFIENPQRWDSVATLYASAHPMGWGVREQRFGFPDSIIEEQNLQEVRKIAEWLHGEWKNGRKVLARCQAGLNRSGLVIALVLLKEGFTANEAIELIRNKRSPHALFNQDFVSQIRKDWELDAAA